MRHRRALLYVLLALLVPLPAFALSGDSRAPSSFSVSVALDRCALLGSAIHCKLDLTFNPVDGATSYTASVTRPDGSVVDAGDVGSSPASVWVGYAGDGSYSVEVSAYGEPEEPDGEAKLLDRDRAEAEDDGGDGDRDGDESRVEDDGGDAPGGEEEVGTEPESEPVEEPSEAGCDVDGGDAAATASEADPGEPAEGEPDPASEEASQLDAGEDPDTITPCPR